MSDIEKYQDLGLERKRGDVIKLKFFVEELDDTFTPPRYVPKDLTNYKIWFTMKVNLAHTDAQAVTQETLAGGGIVLLDQSADATKGRGTITVSGAKTKVLTKSETLFCDLQVMANADSEPQTAASFLMSITADVTTATT